MDLIYADETRRDLGVISSYDIDMAYGEDENNFECSISRLDHCCKQGYFIYAEGTEYGGIVDSIKVDTDDGEITYIGRTWHGILQNKVICPDAGQDYLVLNGDANAVLREIINRVGLSDLFTTPDWVSGINIVDYQVDRYAYAYDAIRKMLKIFSAKLQVVWQNYMILLSAEPIYDYSQDEEFDESQIDFSLTKNFAPVNHMICLGQGDLRDRAVIHIFTDENGGIQQYLVDPNAAPVQDSDYILDTSRQLLTDQDEVVEVYDYSSAEITKNYIQMQAAPADWTAEGCQNYFELNSENEYKSVAPLDIKYELQRVQPYGWATLFGDYYEYKNGQYSKVTGVTAYNLLTARPANWAAGYGEYYELKNSQYTKVTGVKQESYVPQTAQPADWSRDYSKYYYYYTDGVTTEYKSVEGITYYTYEMQTRQPTDWATNYQNYFRHSTAREIAQARAEIEDLRHESNELTSRLHVVQLNIVSLNKKAEAAKTKYGEQSAQYAMALARLRRVQNEETDLQSRLSAVNALIETKSSAESLNEWYAVAVDKKGRTPAWAPRRYWTRYTHQKAPAWNKTVRYTKIESIVAPTWVANKYYLRNDNSAPTWAAQKYYTETNKKVAPEWVAGKYYREVIDRYAVMVASAIEKLEAYHKSDDLEIDMEERDQVYDVGDIVGATEQVTGLRTTQEVLKKIIKITNDDVAISYEVG